MDNYHFFIIYLLLFINISIRVTVMSQTLAGTGFSLQTKRGCLRLNYSLSFTLLLNPFSALCQFIVTSVLFHGKGNMLIK